MDRETTTSETEDDNLYGAASQVSERTSFETPVTTVESFTKPGTPQKRKKLSHHSSQVDQVMGILKQSIERDDCDVYGEHVACKLKKYTKKTVNVVQHRINNILFEADMGYLDVPPSTSNNVSQQYILPHSQEPSFPRYNSSSSPQHTSPYSPQCSSNSSTPTVLAETFNDPSLLSPTGSYFSQFNA